MKLAKKGAARLTKKSAARLASISALGAGALGVAAGTAEAAVHYSALNVKVGFGTGFGNNATLTITGTVTIFVFRSSTRGTGPHAGYQAWSVWLNGSSIEASNASAGQTWNQLIGGGKRSEEELGQRLISTSTDFVGRTQSPNGTFYRLFRFRMNRTGPYYYGWLELSQTVTGTVGPEVTVLGYAWDDTGAMIQAGQTTSNTPETPLPSTMLLGALGALALGAVGLRRWREGGAAA
jgi:hypothetical protein